jgi:hypothetical protein
MAVRIAEWNDNVQPLATAQDRFELTQCSVLFPCREKPRARSLNLIPGALMRSYLTDGRSKAGKRKDVPLGLYTDQGSVPQPLETPTPHPLVLVTLFTKTLVGVYLNGGRERVDP